MPSIAKVFLWGTHIGTVALEDGQQVARFEYAPDFLGSNIELSPFTMPLGSTVYSFPALPFESFHGLPGLLSDSLPDKFGNAVIDAWLASQGRTPDSFNAVERLCYTGSRGMGGLEYVPDLGPSPTTQQELEVGKLVTLAQEILSRRKQFSASVQDNAMEQIIRVGTSAGGARAKAVIAWNPETGEVRSGQVEAGEGFAYWLMKFDGLEGNRDKEGNDKPGYTRIEYAYYLMALAAGIQMSPSQLYLEGPRAHFLTQRFDRNPLTGDKLHMLTLGALVHADFNLPGSYSYEQAAQTVIRLGLGQEEVEQLFRRMVFNVIARNQDDHVKNISFLMNRRGEWSLAPAYDMTYAYNPGGAWTGSHQMTINGKRDGLDEQVLLDSAKHMNISTARAKRAIAEVQNATARWFDFAQEAGLPEARAAMLRKQFVLVLAN